MNKPLPPRKARYIPSYIGHGLIGVFAFIGILFGGLWRVVAVVGLALYLTYQTVEFLRRGDTPARDVGDTGAGYVAAIAVWLAILWRGRVHEKRKGVPGCEANARLIAAAPETLEQRNELLAALEAVLPAVCKCGSSDCFETNARAVAEAAIAKARA